MSALSDIPEVRALMALYTANRRPFLLLVVDVDEDGDPVLRNVGTTPAADAAESEQIMREMATWYLGKTENGWSVTYPVRGDQ